MKNLIPFLFFFIGVIPFFSFIQAQSQQPPSERVQILQQVESVGLAERVATDSSSSTGEAQLASSSASIIDQEKLEQDQLKDLTQTTTKEKSPLAQYLDRTEPTLVFPFNSMQLLIRQAVDNGVPANILVLLILFPVISTLIIFFRHVIGLEGFGVYTPAVLAVAFVSTGFLRGLLLFFAIFISTTIGKMIVSRLKLQYLPRTSLVLWFVSLSMFFVLLLSPYIPFTNLATIGIFPMLVLVLLSENFLQVQSSSSMWTAIQLTGETLLLAFISASVMRSLSVQEFVILHPEITIALMFALNLMIGKYTGVRVMEILRFRSILESEE
ncbi:MAG: hypothetical protein UX04_C0004G0033 [Microgenomates group bacterium GW2011_GWF2_45_18]|nr:MAG: hypothetical protein UW18_C0004G0033 [Microgenomates group bacterium GW2011_GWF1_44_10]KKU01689.1 MAG: hypothetical protein UX04_C0004G0033 [Microgenomates group bacterium GW2011_GWF2_45_18]OGJ41528.1 MAG: hypothetical protein A2378_00320 [Candidatus Pacebacteria bacterium RIFOXYB1_FULL_44_10]HAU99544.1 hypothetical protein [Candidatus Paceibacterota bacterium]HAX01468.1 hypothetical protein [Candidatus Paceibacterota bacterium]